MLAPLRKNVKEKKILATLLKMLTKNAETPKKCWQHFWKMLTKKCWQHF
jgi:hypothetical protein